MATSLDRSGNQYQVEHLHQYVYQPTNLVKIGLVVSEISLLQAIVKKEEDDERKGTGLCNAAVTFFPILSFSLSLFLFNDRLEQRNLGNYKTDLHQIFSMVDMLV